MIRKKKVGGYKFSAYASGTRINTDYRTQYALKLQINFRHSVSCSY